MGHFSHFVIKSLEGHPGLYCLRIGDFRIIFSIDGNNVIINKITPRGQAYKRIERDKHVISFDEVGIILDDIANELPKVFYRELNGGINLLPDVKVHPDSKNSDDLYILGEYYNDPRGLGRYIVIYYGSFVKVHTHIEPSRQRKELRRVLLHEFTHHLESLAGERGLEIKDDQKLERYKQW